MGYPSIAINKAVSRVLFNLSDTPAACGIRKSVDGKEYISAYAAAAVTLGDVKMLTFAVTSGREVTAAATATNPVGKVQLAVAAKTTTAAGITWFQTFGIALAKVNGSVTAGDYLEVISTAGKFTSESTTESVNSGAIAIDANTSGDAVKTVFLLGRFVTIAGA